MRKNRITNAILTNSINPEITRNFPNDIEKIVKDNKMDYIDAVIYYCDQKEIDIEAIPLLIKDSYIKDRLQEDGEKRNLLKKTDRLPI